MAPADAAATSQKPPTRKKIINAPANPIPETMRMRASTIPSGISGPAWAALSSESITVSVSVVSSVSISPGMVRVAGGSAPGAPFPVRAAAPAFSAVRCFAWPSHTHRRAGGRTAQRWLRKAWRRAARRSAAQRGMYHPLAERSARRGPAPRSPEGDAGCALTFGPGDA